MSEIRQVGSEVQVRAAIARAANATGVDFDYLLAQAKIESSLDPSARAGTSSAAGLYQFTTSTWLSTLSRHGAEHGLDWASGISGNPALRERAMALRFDPHISALMAGELANDNRADLTSSLGRTPDSAELYLAHFLGSEGASRFLNGLATDPTQSAAALLPAAAGANRAIFYGPGGARSLSEVMGLVRSKVSGAMEGVEPDFATILADPSAAVPTPIPGGPVAQEFHVAAAQAAPEAPRAMASMAETLRQTFALDSKSSTAPGHVRMAYARLSEMGF